jgi:hypothetical protein
MAQGADVDQAAGEGADVDQAAGEGAPSGPQRVFGAVDAGPPCRIRTLGQRHERRGSSQTQASEPALSAPNSALAYALDAWWTSECRLGRPGKPLDAEYPVDIVRHRYVLVGDATLGVCHQRETDSPPTDVDVGVVILSFGVLGHPAHGVDTGEERGKLDRPAQRPLGPLPAVELRQCGIYLLIR